MRTTHNDLCGRCLHKRDGHVRGGRCRKTQWEPLTRRQWLVTEVCDCPAFVSVEEWAWRKRLGIRGQDDAAPDGREQAGGVAAVEGVVCEAADVEHARAEDAGAHGASARRAFSPPPAKGPAG